MEMILEKSRELLYKETDQEKETDDPSKTPEEIRKSKKEEQEKLNKKEEKIKKEKKPRKSEEKLVTKAKIEDALQNLKSGFEKIKLDDLQLLLIRDVQKVKTRPLKEGEEYAKVMAETQCECVLKKARICMSLLLRGKKK
ncbi:hypothetical protein EIN_061000 [Entamoeba invadens IP1]|uniref:hypothetical protein n=1 Tax=Entamoeba invadens IP1 TaxID=370355 RepID=UPI0002C3EA69|nr:hypothetical protein EIN_061000 [Entamoeba invadens IP1]ELP93535.1 hypothetical protein EIN_061000 [Entamoeba invadens IP1]|eukprot:XP_004260306.1 hypothetical protein EIN_061000 [Entamoeba invadens IP1]